MPLVEQVVRVCDPHDDDTTLATATIRYLFEGRWYTVDVCEDHRRWWATAIGELAGYSTKLSRQPVDLSYELADCDPDLLHKSRTELEQRFLAPEPNRRAKIVIPREFERTGEVINLDGPAVVEQPEETATQQTIRDWAITDHAWMRMAQRQITPHEVWGALQNLDHASSHPGNEPHKTIFTLGDLSILVQDEEQVVLTVYRPSTSGSSLIDELFASAPGE